MNSLTHLNRRTILADVAAERRRGARDEQTAMVRVGAAPECPPCPTSGDPEWEASFNYIKSSGALDTPEKIEAAAKKAEACGCAEQAAQIRSLLHGTNPANTMPNAPSWWPSTLSWPPTAAPPTIWNPAMKWPPTTQEDLAAGMGSGAPTGGAAAPAVTSGMSPAAKDGIAAGAGAILGAIVAKIAIGATAMPLVGGAIAGALIGHVVYTLATGNQVTRVATKGCRSCQEFKKSKELPR